jgi:RecQ-mediated genome instability protein 1
MDIAPVLAAIRREYPSPRVDPVRSQPLHSELVVDVLTTQAWVQACVQLLLDHGQDPTPDAVVCSLFPRRGRGTSSPIERNVSLPTDRGQIEQYLHSDLSHTTLPSGLIPAQAHNVHLFPQPTLLQIISLTEIAASAFQLQTVLEQRRDVLDGASRIRRMDDEDTEDEEVGEGKLPSYPRGMLRLELTDGERVIKGIEYRRIEGLELGETALGCKVGGESS